jgi:hypothetical protein
MTMRTLLLGAAAGLVTVGAAKAADLPMTKAEAVEYVKVCTEFGEGFFYIPGTDTCLKISGEVRADIRFQNRTTRETDVVFFKTEPRLKFDARTNTEYGILRSYIQLNMPVFSTSVLGGSSGAAFNLDKAFIQFGGLTAGYAHTFFGIYDADYGNTIFAPYYASQSTVNLLAYTAVFGGGFSATLSVEDGTQHRTFLAGFDPTGAAGAGAVVSPLPYGGQSMPDFVGQLRADGAWGEAAVFGAVHQIRYPGLAITGPNAAGVYDTPDANYGWAVGAGVGYNLPFLAGSHIALEATYADGANNYLGFGSQPDSLFTFVAPSDTDQGHGWSITGEFGVNVSPVLNVTAFGSYLDYSGGSVSGSSTGAAGGAINTLDQGDFKNWVAGINATYTIVPGLVVQPEVFYQHVDTNVVDAQDNFWGGGVRLKRTF